MSAASRLVEAMIAELHLEVLTFGEQDFTDELRGEDPPGPEEAALEKERAIVLLDVVLDEIQPIARDVLRRLYGFDGEPLNHAETGRLFGLTAKNVEFIEEHALASLRKRLEREGVDGASYDGNPTMFGGVVEKHSMRADNRPSDISDLEVA